MRIMIVSSVWRPGFQQVPDQGQCVLDHRCIERVDDLFSLTPAGNQACLLEHGKMMGDSGLGHVEPLRQGASGHLAAAEQPQDLPPGWVRQRLENPITHSLADL